MPFVCRCCQILPLFDAADAKNKLMRSVAGGGVEQMSNLQARWDKFELMMESHQMMVKEQVLSSVTLHSLSIISSLCRQYPMLSFNELHFNSSYHPYQLLMVSGYKLHHWQFTCNTHTVTFFYYIWEKYSCFVLHFFCSLEPVFVHCLHVWSSAWWRAMWNLVWRIMNRIWRSSRPAGTSWSQVIECLMMTRTLANRPSKQSKRRNWSLKNLRQREKLLSKFFVSVYVVCLPHFYDTPCPQ